MVLPRRCAEAVELAVGAEWHALLLSFAVSIATRGITEVHFFHVCTCLHRCAVHDSTRTRHYVDVLPSSKHCLGSAVPVLRHLVTYFVPHRTIFELLINFRKLEEIVSSKSGECRLHITQNSIRSVCMIRPDTALL